MGIEEGRLQRSGAWQRNDEEENAPVEAISTGSVYQAATEARRFGSGLRASGFEPQRHAFYVLGRPAQVMVAAMKKHPFNSVSGVADPSCLGVLRDMQPQSSF